MSKVFNDLITFVCLMCAIVGFSFLFQCSKKLIKQPEVIQEVKPIDKPLIKEETKPVYTAPTTSSASFDQANITMLRQSKSVLVPIHFAYNKSALSSTAKVRLSKIQAFIASYSNVKIRVVGHCDIRGTDEYNTKLGQDRAEAVSSFLKDISDRLVIESKGKSEPMFLNCTDEPCHAKNRRVEFYIIKE